jgi:hypothetical protein
MSQFLQSKELLSDEELILRLQSLAYEFYSVSQHLETEPDAQRVGPYYGAIGFLRMSEEEFNYCAEFEKIANPRQLLGRSEQVHAVVNQIKKCVPAHYSGFMYRVRSSGHLMPENNW